jgi:RimJ/RimL family protein N-acetyltransferase
MTTHIPLLRTARLQLVVPEARHAAAFAALHADPYTMRYIGQGRPLDRTDAWLQLAMLIGHWQMRGYGVWIVEDPPTAPSSAASACSIRPGGMRLN